MPKGPSSIDQLILRQAIESALASCSEHLPDGWKVSFVAYPPDKLDGDGCSTIFLTDGSMADTQKALESLASDSESEVF